MDFFKWSWLHKVTWTILWVFDMVEMEAKIVKTFLLPIIFLIILGQMGHFNRVGGPWGSAKGPSRVLQGCIGRPLEVLWGFHLGSIIVGSLRK